MSISRILGWLGCGFYSIHALFFFMWLLTLLAHNVSTAPTTGGKTQICWYIYIYTGMCGFWYVSVIIHVMMHINGIWYHGTRYLVPCIPGIELPVVPGTGTGTGTGTR